MTATRPPVGLYLHVPFCLSVCPYCDFVVYPGRDARGPSSRLDRFVRALERELELRAGAGGPAGGGLGSVYLGGGTPSLLPAAAIARVLARIEESYGIAPGAEITIEANPGPSDRGDLAGFRAAGVNRLSLGAQSTDPAELRTLGRRHSAADVGDTIAAARVAGFENISVDLLYDVPGQSLAAWSATLRETLGLGVQHVSAYALSLDDPEREGLTGRLGDHLPLRRGARRWRERARLGQDEDRAAELYERADELLSAAGLGWYELSNWSLPGYGSRHNLVYWRREAYEGVGPGAHAFDGGRVRRWNAARLDAYLDALDPRDGREPVLPPGGTDELADDAVEAERLMLGLRLAQGVERSAVRAEPVASAFSWATSEGLVETDGETIRLSRRGRLLGDELFARLV